MPRQPLTMEQESWIRMITPLYQSNQYTYAITITPKGVNKNHGDYSHELRQAIRSIRSVRECYLIKEYDNTCHFHGIIKSNRNLVFRTMRKQELYVFKYKPISREHTLDQYYWIRYMLKYQVKGRSYYSYIKDGLLGRFTTDTFGNLT